MKKILCAFLVAVVLLTIGFAATTSVELNSDYREAIDVLTGIGVINGFEDGTFKPTVNLSRMQMAKMICAIKNSGDDVNTMYKDACTFVDTKDLWGAGYVAYCAAEGIINGRAPLYFDPNTDVTGAEAMKMALCLMGYDAAIEGFIGDNWKTNVVKTARSANLLEDLPSDIANRAISRGEAAQLLFNCLNGDTVEYDDKGSEIKIGDIAFITSASKAVHGKLVREEYFGGDKEHDELKIKMTIDDFGLISATWIFGKTDDHKDNEIAKSAHLEATFDGEINADDLYAITGTVAADDVFVVHVDGIADTTITADDINTTTGRAKHKILADVIKVYVDDNTDDDGRLIQVIAFNYFYSEIYDHTIPHNVNDKEYITLDNGIFETEEFSDRDVDNEVKVAYTYANGEIQSVTRMDPIESGVVKNLTVSDDTIEFYARQHYTLATNYAGVDIDAKSEYDLYLTPNGRVLYAEETVGAASDIYMVMSTAETYDDSLDNDGETFKVRLLGTDGMTTDLAVAEIDGEIVNEKNFRKLYRATAPNRVEDDATNCLPGALVSYRLNNKGEAKITTHNSYDTKPVNGTYQNNLTDLPQLLTDHIANSTTDFVLITVDDDTYEYRPVYGINALRAIFENYDFYVGAYATDGNVVDTAFIFADNFGNVTTQTLFYFNTNDKGGLATGDAKYTYYYVEAIANGNITTVKIDEDCHTSKGTPIGEGEIIIASNYSVNEEDIIDRITESNTDNYIVYHNAHPVFDDEILVVDGKVYLTDGVRNVFVYNNDEERFERKALTTFRERDNTIYSTVILIKDSIDTNYSIKTIIAIN